jgi:hypothetical protein
MKKLILMMTALIMIGCTVPETEVLSTVDAKANIERKGKKERGIYMKPLITSNQRLAANRVVSELEPYNGDFNLSETVDFDNDGVNDEVTINQKCYFPRTFANITVNGEIVSYNIQFNAVILGYQDVNNDGFTDIIFEGGKSIAYNHGETYSEFNVGYNLSGQATPLKDVVQSLVITSVDPNPEFIRWDLSEFGYNNFTFHVFLFNKSLNDYEQTTTYGEFGFYYKDKIIQGDVYILRFTNLGDNCSSVDVEFSI